MSKIPLQEAIADLTLKKSLLIADGAMSTSLYDRGFYINRSFEELCLTHPNVVLDVSLGFRKAGANLLLTNTFSATIPKLTQYGLQDRMDEILRAAVRIARDAAGGEAWSVALIGPLGIVLEPLGPTSFEEARAWYREMVKVFIEEGIEGFSLESFHDLNELECAIQSIRDLTDLPILAHVAIQENQRTSFGHSMEEFARRMATLNVDALGISGAVGPSGLLTALEELRVLTNKPISIKPNAGLPSYVNDQYIYLCNPDYIGKYAKRFVQAGAQIVGGCSGFSDVHIRAISNTVRMLTPQPWYQPNQTISIGSEKSEAKPAPRQSRSRLGEQLAAGKIVFSVEVNPPTGVEAKKFAIHCEELVAGGVEFINIPDGARAMARMSSLQLATYVRQNFRLEPIPHFTCRDRNLIGLQSDLLGAHVNGVRNILLVTGDPPKLGNCPDATAVYDVDAIGLTHIVSNMNHGLDLGGSAFGDPTQFLVGVALNPTAHNLDQEIKRFRYKIEAGADFAITQPIYDVHAFEKFLKEFGSVPIPIIMGIWPLVSLRNAEFLKNEVPGVQVPDWIISEMEKAGDSKEEALKRGVDIATQTLRKARDLVAGFQISAPFNKVDLALKVIHAF